MTNKKCSRCGGTGLYNKGTVVNGVCFGCGGSGLARARAARGSRPKLAQQWVIVSATGVHLAINTDRKVLEEMFPSIDGAVAIEEYKQ